MAQLGEEITVDIPFVGGVDQKIAQKILPPDGARLWQVDNARVESLGKLEPRLAFGAGVAYTASERNCQPAVGVLKSQTPVVFTGDAADVRVTPATLNDPAVLSAVASYTAIGAESPYSAASASLRGPDHNTSIGRVGDYEVIVIGTRYTVRHRTSGVVFQQDGNIGTFVANDFTGAIVVSLTAAIVIVYQNSATDLRARILQPQLDPYSTGTDVLLTNTLGAGAATAFDAKVYNAFPTSFIVFFPHNSGMGQAWLFDSTGVNLPAGRAGLGAGVMPQYTLGLAEDQEAAVFFLYDQAAAPNMEVQARWSADGTTWAGTGWTVGVAVDAKLQGVVVGIDTGLRQVRVFYDTGSTGVATGDVGVMKTAVIDKAVWPGALTVSGVATVSRCMWVATRPFKLVEGGIPYIVGRYWQRASITGGFAVYYRPTLTSGLFVLTGTGMILGNLLPDQCAPMLFSARRTAHRGVSEVLVEENGPTVFASPRLLRAAHESRAAGTFVYDVFGCCRVEIDSFKQGKHLDGDQILKADLGLFQVSERRSVEIPFWIMPFTVFDGGNVAGGALGAGNFGVCVVYAWTDEMGEKYYSAPSPPIIVASGGAARYVRISIPTCRITNRPGVRILVFRTEVGPGPIYYLEEDLANDTTVDTIAYDLGRYTADTELAYCPTLYTTGGVLENDCPQVTGPICVHDNRLFVVHDDFEIRYSKEKVSGFGYAFNWVLNIQADKALGKIKDLFSFADRLWIVQEAGISCVPGVGATDTGVGGYERPIRIGEGVLSDTVVGSVATPAGTLLVTKTGPWILRRDLSLEPIGVRVAEDRSSWASASRYSSGTLVNKYEAAISRGSNILVWNYALDLISHITAPTHSALAATGQGTLLVADDTNLYSDASGTYGTMTVGTGWIRPGKLNGFSRVKWIYVLGTWLASHTQTVTIHYEDGTSEVCTKAWTATDEPYVLRIKPSRQKAGAFRVVVQVPSGGAALHGLSLEILLKSKYPLGRTKTT